MTKIFDNFIKVHGNEGSDIKIEFLHIKKMYLTFRALNHRLRQSILKMLEENEKLTVTEIIIHLRLEQSVASQHLAILRRANVIYPERVGKFIYYHLNHQRLAEIAACVMSVLS